MIQQPPSGSGSLTEEANSHQALQRIDHSWALPARWPYRWAPQSLNKNLAPMTRPILTFTNLLLAALVVGTMFGIWLGYNPAELSSGAYIEQQQHAIRALNVTMPVLGALTELLTLASAILSRGDRRRFALFVAALVCFVAAGVMTRFLNQPINAVVITWSALAPPTNWVELRDEWWRWHILRTAIGVAGLGLLIAASLLSDTRASHRR
jgi:uncharacterized membrane protein